MVRNWSEWMASSWALDIGNYWISCIFFPWAFICGVAIMTEHGQRASALVTGVGSKVSKDLCRSDLHRLEQLSTKGNGRCYLVLNWAGWSVAFVASRREVANKVPKEDIHVWCRSQILVVWVRNNCPQNEVMTSVSPLNETSPRIREIGFPGFKTCKGYYICIVQDVFCSWLLLSVGFQNSRKLIWIPSWL